VAISLTSKLRKVGRPRAIRQATQIHRSHGKK